jgi:hypothetical protein
MFSTKTFYSIILLIAFNYLMDCPVSYTVHKGTINCYCRASSELSEKKKPDKSDTGLSSALTAINISPWIYYFPVQNRSLSTTPHEMRYVTIPFLTTIKLLL